MLSNKNLLKNFRKIKNYCIPADKKNGYFALWRQMSLTLNDNY